MAVKLPKVSKEVQTDRDLKRVEILSKELATERQLLAKNPNDSELHNRNIKALEQELEGGEVTIFPKAAGFGNPEVSATIKTTGAIKEAGLPAPKKKKKIVLASKSGIRVFRADELIPQKKSTIREFREDELIEDEGALAGIQGQFVSGAQDVLDIGRGAIQSTIGSAEFSLDEGFRHIPPDEAVARAEAGEFDLPGAADREPEGVFEKGGRFAGQTAALVPALGFAAAGVAIRTGLAVRTLTSFPRKIVAEFGQAFLKDPSKVIGIETGIGFAAGSGGGLAQEFFPNSASAKFTGEILGSVAIPALMPVQIALRGISFIKKQFSKIFGTPKVGPKGMARAKERIGRAVTPEGRVDARTQLGRPTTIDPETGLPVLTDAQLTDAPGLMALEKSILKESEELTIKADIQIANANAVIQKSMTDISPTPISRADDAIQAAHEHMDSLLDTRLRIAAQKTRERTEALGPAITKEQANLIAREEIETALVAAREHEKQLYSLIDPEVKAPFHNSLAELKKIRKETGKAQQEDIADVAKVLATLGPKKSKNVLDFDFANATPDELVQRLADEMQVVELVASEIQPVEQAAEAIIDTLIAGGASRAQAAKQVTQMLVEAAERNTLRVLDESSLIAQGLEPVIQQPLTTIKELRAVYSKLREVSRNARSGEKTNFNMARIADDIADKITEDIAANVGGEEMADVIETAITFSRNMNERFSRGAVGKILGRKGAGELGVPPGLTLEQSIGGHGPKAREAMDDIVKVFDSPEAPGSALVINSAEDWLRGRFLKAAVFKGQLNVVSAQRFIRQNEDLLSRLPNLRNQLDEVIESGEALVITERQRSRISLDDPKVSKATMFIKSGPVETFKSLGKLKPAAAEREMQLLINRVAKDETGEALAGLKSGFVEYLFSGARGTAIDSTGLPFLSGFKLRRTLNEPSTKAMVKKLFTKVEQGRLEIYTQDFIRLERARLAIPAPEGVIGDLPGTAIIMIARIAGAAVGRRLSALTGGATIQTPAIVSQRFKELAAANMADPAGRLLRDAVHDGALYRELLEPPLTETGELGPVAIRRFNIWAFNAIAEYGGSFADDEDEEEE